MALRSLTGVESKGLPGGPGGTAEDFDALIAAVGELQRLKVNAVAGAAADTNIPIAGIATEDTLLCVLRLNRDATAANIDMDNLTGEASITSAGNIQIDTTVTTGDKLIVFWFDKTA